MTDVYSADDGALDELEEEVEGGPLEIDADRPLSAEDEARAKGWKPLAEFTGNPAHWRDASEFLQRGLDSNLIMREENRRLAKDVHRQTNQIAELKAQGDAQLSELREMRELARKADQRGYDRAMRDLKEQRAAAVDAGDRQTFDQVEAQIEELDRHRPAAAAAPAPAPAAAPTSPSPVLPEIQQFWAENPWFKTDPVLRQAMTSNVDIVEARNPTWDLADKLAEARRRTAADFPEKFTMPQVEAPRSRPAAPTPVARPSAPQAPRQRAAAGLSWDSIPDPAERREAQAAYENQKRADPDFTVTEYLTVYLDPRADALALRRARPRK